MSHKLVSLHIDEGTYYTKIDADTVIAEKDKEIAELKERVHDLDIDLEGAKATAYADSVDAGMRERRLKRTLWLARARSAHNAAMMWEILSDEYLSGAEFTIDFRCVGEPDVSEFQMFRECKEWMTIYENVERKCRAMAQKFGG